MTIILAKLFGLYFIALGIAGIFNPKRIGKLYQLMMQNDALLYLGGIIALFIGAFVVSVHNIWIASWPVIISIIGWISLIKGFGLVSCSGFAKSLSFMYEKSASFYRGIGLILLLIGLFLTYHGFEF